MFRVTTLDMENVPKTVTERDFSQDFGKDTNLTVSGQLSAETYCMALGRFHSWPNFLELKINTARHAAEFDGRA